jgi:hypothetical protein
MVLTKSPTTIVGAVLLLALAVFTLHATPTASASPTALAKTYKNTDYGFALKMPADFSAYPPNASPGRDATGAKTGEAIVLQNQKGDMVQIVITPDDRASPDNTFTATDLEREAPYVDPSDAQPVQLAQGVTGMTFTEPAADGASTDALIFTYRGNLYELSANTTDRALFEAMMETWSFQ